MIYSTLIGATLLVVPALMDPFRASKELFLILAVSVWLGLTYIQRGKLAAPSPTLLVLWCLAGLLSWFTASDTFAAMEYWGVGFALILFCSAHRETSERQIFYLVAGLGLIQVALGCGQILFLNDPSTFTDFPSRLKFAGTLGNPQYVASFLGLGICLALFAKEKTKFHWVVVLLFTAGLLLSRVQGTSLCLLVVVLWFAPLTRKQRWALAGMAILGVALLESYWHWHTFRGRMLLSLTALKMTWSSGGLGVGLSQFGNHLLAIQRELLGLAALSGFRENAGFADHPHNEYLALVAELGILGAALLIWIFFQVRRLKVSAAVGALLLFTALDALFSFPWRLVPVALVVGLLIAREIPVQRKWEGLPLAILSAILMIVSVTGFVVQYAEGRADRLARQGRVPEAERTVDWALRLSPEKPELNLFKGRLCYLQFDANAALRWAKKANLLGERIDSLKLEGLALMDLKLLSDAEKLYQRLAATLPNQITAHFYLGEIYSRQGRFEEARREFSLLPSRRAKNAKAIIDQWRARDFL